MFIDKTVVNYFFKIQKSYLNGYIYIFDFLLIITEITTNKDKWFQGWSVNYIS